MSPCKECIRKPCLYRADCNLQCDRQIKPHRTNFQRITESPEKLAQIFQSVFLNGVDHGIRKVDFGKTGGSLKFWLDWLNEPWEEDES